MADIATVGRGLAGLLETLRGRTATPAVILLCDPAAREIAVRTAREEALDFVVKPFSMAELDLRVAKARDLQRLSHERQVLRGERDLIHRTSDLIGKSPAILRVLELVDKVAPTSSSVVLAGETGTGKEVIAGTIHFGSPRAAAPFVKVNCATLPETLLESELFGHEKGAFTGAEKLRVGRFEQAHEGTLFLDEIADVSFPVQAKLLRVLQEREFERLGSNRTISVDVRIITATSKDLPQEIREGRFRPDLYYRLNVVTIQVPPLRERGGDVELLARHFMHRYATDLKKAVTDIDEPALSLLTSYRWPGNIRELKNVIERAVIMTETTSIRVRDLSLPWSRELGGTGTGPAGAPGAGTASGPPGDAARRALVIPPDGLRWEEMERDLVVQALERCGWVQKDAARLLGLSSRVLNYKIRTFGITHPTWRQNR